MKVFDIALEAETLELQTANGDFVVGESTEQHRLCTLMASKGDFKAHPSFGAAIDSYINDERPSDMIASIKRNLIADGMKVSAIYLEENELKIEAEYV